LGVPKSTCGSTYKHALKNVPAKWLEQTEAGGNNTGSAADSEHERNGSKVQVHGNVELDEYGDGDEKLLLGWIRAE
jgi:hypothetical protein